MSRAIRLAASVQRAFPCPDPLVMTLAAKVFGESVFPSFFGRGDLLNKRLSPARLAAQGGSQMAEHVDIQVKSCIEWLQGELRCWRDRSNRANVRILDCAGERIESRRYAAVLVLRELTRAAPGLVYDNVPDLLDNLWTALRDAKVTTNPSNLTR